MAPSPVRSIILRTGKTCFKVLRSLASASRLPRSRQRVLPAAAAAATPADKVAAKAVTGDTHAAWLDDVVDLEDLQNRLNEAAERKVCV